MPDQNNHYQMAVDMLNEYVDITLSSFEKDNRYKHLRERLNFAMSVLRMQWQYERISS